MTLTEFRYIVAVARERHFGRAASACHVSQPTLSVAVRKLEEELGVALFERGGHEIAVTPVGERVVAQAQRVLAEANALRRVADQAQDPLAGPLRLGAIYTIGPYLFPHLLPILHQTVPQMSLIVEENFTARLSERLRHGDLDAILVALPFSQPGTQSRTLYEEPFRVVVPAGHAWAEREALQPHELRDQPVLLLGSGHCFREQVLTACPDCGSADLAAAPGMESAVEGSSLETIRHMVASGMGITVLPCTAVAQDHYAAPLLATRPFAEPAPRRRVALVWRRRFARPEAVQALEAAIRRCDLGCVTPIHGDEAG
ncbi:MAG: hydrogen peroxide-inducible genes activator [Halofilum sp. (in: g-proteobacteria)]